MVPPLPRNRPSNIFKQKTIIFFQNPQETGYWRILKAGVHVNLSEILVSLKRGWKGEKGLWNTIRQLPDRTMAHQVVGQHSTNN